MVSMAVVFQYNDFARRSVQNNFSFWFDYVSHSNSQSFEFELSDASLLNLERLLNMDFIPTRDLGLLTCINLPKL